MAYSAGTAYLEVVPSFLNVESLLAKGARDIAKSLDKALGNQLGDAVRNAARRAEPETERAAKVLGKTFADNAIKHVRSAAASISETDRILAPLRKELIAISEIDITKGFDEKGFIARIEKAYGALRKAQQDAQGKNAVGRFTNAGNAATELGAVKDIVEAARRRGFAAGDSFSDAYVSRLKAMDRALPDLKITAASSQEARAVAALKQRIQDALKLEIGKVTTRDDNPLNLKIGARINGEDLKREIGTIEGILDQFVERFESHELVLPLDKARQQAGGFFEDIKTQEDRANEKATAQYLKDWDAALAERARRERAVQQQLANEAERLFRRTTAGELSQRVGQAAERIVDLPVHLQVNDIDREMAAIRSRIKALGDVKIGLDLDAETFAGEVEQEFVRLQAIARDKTIDIEVRADAARAATELGAVLALVNRIDGQKAEVKVDTDGAIGGFRLLEQALTLNLGRLGAIIAIGSSIGTALVPAAAAAAAGIGAIGTAALAAGSGIGVLMLAFSGIGDAVKALSQYADSQAKSNVSLARSASQVAAANQQIKSAEMALANTRRNNAEAAIKAQRAIKDAIEDQRDAVVDVARANQDAVQKVADAQRDLTDANKDDILARSRLNDAYVEARRALADLSSQIRGNALDQRQATLDIAKAKADLDKLLANPRATQAEREQADITYQQRLLQMEDLKRRGAELSDDQIKQNKLGIEGSEQVTKAKADIARADEARLGAQRALTRAQEDLVRTQLDGSRKLRDADRKVADARAAAADQQKDAAYAEYTAMQSLVSARRALETATNRDSVAGGAQLDNLRTAMEKLSPAAQSFAKYIFGLRDAFYDLRAAADPVLSALQQALTSLIGGTSEEAKTKLKPVFDFVHRVAVALGDIILQFANLLKGPTFTRFFGYISQTAVPTLQLLYDMFANVLEGVINLFLAFTPLTGDVNKGLLGLTESFRDWSRTLESNQGFQNLLQYIRDNWPPVAHLLGQFIKAIGKLVEAAAPVGSVVVKIFAALFEWINRIPEKVLIALVAGIAAAAAAIGGFALAAAAISLDAAGLIAGAIAVLVVAFSALAGSSTDTGKILRRVWEGLKTAAQVTFDFIKKAIVALRPVFADMVEAAVAFYKDGIKPAWDAVVALISSAINALRPYFDDIQGTFVQIGKLAFYLYDQAILPAFKGIMIVVHTLFDTFKPVFEAIGTIIGTLAGVIFWLLNKVILPVVGAIVVVLVKTLGPTFEFLWKFVLKPILTALGIAFQVLAALVKVAIGIITLVLKGLGALFKWLYEVAIKPQWDLLVKYVLRPMADWISKYIGPAWKKALEFLGDQWDTFKRRIGAVTKVILHFALNEGLLKAYNWLAEKFNITPKNVHITEPSGDWYTKSGFARGGAVTGPGTETSDSIRARLSRGEHVLTAAEVRAAGGHEAIYDWRRELMRGHPAPPEGDGFGDWLKKTAKSIGKKASDVFDSTVDFITNPVKSLTDLAKGLFDKVPYQDSWIVQKLMTIPTRILDGLKEKVTGLFSGGADGLFGGVLGGAKGGNGWKWEVAVVEAAFPGTAVYSTFRPGAVTLSGNRSYHAIGRAVDFQPKRPVAEWIARTYGKNTLELITPWRDLMLWHGKPHKYSRAIEAQHGVFGNNAHIHWAYDNGGLLPDTRNMPGGTMQIFHGRRLPDKVLTDEQWRSMATLANQARNTMAAGNTYNFEFRDTTLDASRLKALQDREAVMARYGRSR